MTRRNLGPTELKRLHREWRHRTPERRVAVLLESVEGPFNVGGVLRTAAAMRVDDVWLVGRTPGPDNPKVGRTALGTERYLTLHRAEGTAEAVHAARARGYALVGVELAEAAEPVFAMDLSGPVCLALGHEDRGLSSELLGACDRIGFIPQLGRVGSLNVASAAAIALYEARRQGWTA
jgi:tRNA (guanosine-2'-O-)-methyltransferase